MKKSILLLAVCALLFLAVGCTTREHTSTSVPSNVAAVSQVSLADNIPSDLPDASSFKEESAAPVGPTAEFALGPEGSSSLLGAGDSIGEWTLSDLEITLDEQNQVEMLEASFTGEVVLTGTIFPSALLEGAFDFRADESERDRMPYYMLPEATRHEEIWLMLDLQDGIAKELSGVETEGVAYAITVSRYRYIFAYMMAPAQATVTKLERLSS